MKVDSITAASGAKLIYPEGWPLFQHIPCYKSASNFIKARRRGGSLERTKNNTGFSQVLVVLFYSTVIVSTFAQAKNASLTFGFFSLGNSTSLLAMESVFWGQIKSS